MALRVVANTLYGENYATARMRHEWRCEEAGLSVGYRWRLAGRWHQMQALASREMQLVERGSEEEFITEHYWGYTRLSRGRTLEYEVVHPRWQVYPIESYLVDVDFAQVYGAGFSSLSRERPFSVLLAEGSEVEVRSGAH
ncbi:DUF2071 domain-containing protein [Edaphobacter bradus]|uniref:DUF2071 domain-containing protein n=1 Tax=Edaphobacter bradus TaxID=2259016 RepID=UPI0021DFA519|nr:DUF2071 domain-containing protein [Edaphobacter bradus]